MWGNVLERGLQGSGCVGLHSRAVVLHLWWTYPLGMQGAPVIWFFFVKCNINPLSIVMLFLKWPTFKIFDMGFKTVWEPKGLGCSRGLGPENRGLMGFSSSKCVSCNYFIIEMYSVFISVLCVAFFKLEAAFHVNTKIRVCIKNSLLYIWVRVYFFLWCVWRF